MTLSDWLNRLEQLHFKSIDMGLDRIKPVAQRLGVTPTESKNNPFVISVAGTNGKGSTVAVMESLLVHGGYRVGAYTSPHLVHFNERIRLNQQDCDDQQIIAALEAVEAAREGVSLTYFEFTTLAAFYLFQQQNLDVWLLEVGLGGRLDAVNIINPDIAFVTSIDLDHQQWLGNTREAKGIEKIGIGRANKPLIIGEPDLPQAVAAAIQDQGSQLFHVHQHYDYTANSTRWDFSIAPEQVREQASVQGEPLVFQCQPHQLLPVNIASALQAIALSPFQCEPALVQKALDRIRLTGRQQLMSGPVDVMLDVGHNPHAAKQLCTRLQAMQQQNPDLTVHCVMGMLADKAIEGTLMELLSVVTQWYPVNLDSDRSYYADVLRELLQAMGAKTNGAYNSPSQAVNALSHSLAQRANAKNHLILVFGSFFTVADVIQYCPQISSKA